MKKILKSLLVCLFLVPAMFFCACGENPSTSIQQDNPTESESGTAGGGGAVDPEPSTPEPVEGGEITGTRYVMSDQQNMFGMSMEITLSSTDSKCMLKIFVDNGYYKMENCVSGTYTKNDSNEIIFSMSNAKIKETCFGEEINSSTVNEVPIDAQMLYGKFEMINEHYLVMGTMVFVDSAYAPTREHIITHSMSYVSNHNTYDFILSSEDSLEDLKSQFSSEAQYNEGGRVIKESFTVLDDYGMPVASQVSKITSVTGVTFGTHGEYTAVVTYDDGKTGSYSVKISDENIFFDVFTKEETDEYLIQNSNGLMVEKFACATGTTPLSFLNDYLFVCGSAENDYTQVTESMVLNWDSSAVGDKIITISYSGKTSSLVVHFFDAADVSVETIILNERDFLKIAKGADVNDLDDIMATVYYANNTNTDTLDEIEHEYIHQTFSDLGITVEGLNTNNVGAQVVTLRKGSYTQTVCAYVYDEDHNPVDRIEATPFYLLIEEGVASFDETNITIYAMDETTSTVQLIADYIVGFDEDNPVSGMYMINYIVQLDSKAYKLSTYILVM